MVKSYLIDGKSISSNSQYRGTALRAISRFGELTVLLYMVFDATQQTRDIQPCTASLDGSILNQKSESLVFAGRCLLGLSWVISYN